jgi:hypothetical protein
MEFLNDHRMQYLEVIPFTLDRVYKAFVNGKWVGILYQCQEFVDRFRAFRRKGSMHEEVRAHCPRICSYLGCKFYVLDQWHLMV